MHIDQNRIIVGFKIIQFDLDDLKGFKSAEEKATSILAKASAHPPEFAREDQSG